MPSTTEPRSRYSIWVGLGTSTTEPPSNIDRARDIHRLPKCTSEMYSRCIGCSTDYILNDQSDFPLFFMKYF
jgi:hypothetical protein